MTVEQVEKAAAFNCVLVYQINQMKRFIKQEADEKSDEILVKVSLYTDMQNKRFFVTLNCNCTVYMGGVSYQNAASIDLAAGYHSHIAIGDI